MKLLLVSLFIISAAAQAANPELERIKKVYASTLFDIKVGQSWTSEINESEVEMTDQGARSLISKTNEKSIILKVVGSKYYQLTHSISSETDKPSVKVVLEDLNATEDDDLKLDHIKVENDILTVSAFVKTDLGEAQMRATKKLLSPVFCDSDSFESSTTARSLRAYFHTSSCGEQLPVSEVKKLDLKNVEFCDENDECEIRDMSFLTSDL